MQCKSGELFEADRSVPTCAVRLMRALAGSKYTVRPMRALAGSQVHGVHLSPAPGNPDQDSHRVIGSSAVCV
jgi:hypothetical protein